MRILLFMCGYLAFNDQWEVAMEMIIIFLIVMLVVLLRIEVHTKKTTENVEKILTKLEEKRFE